MRTSGVFTVCEVNLKGWQYGRTLTLFPFSDVHRDSPAHADEHWRMFLKRAKEVDDALFLGVGDYMDSYSTSEREIQYHHAKHDSTREREENEDKSRVRGFYKEIGFMEGRLIGLLNGNHYQTYPNGENSDEYLAKLLKTKYLGVCSAIRINFRCGNRVEKIDLFCHHGRGGGRTSVGRFNAVEQLAKISDAEVVLMGDNHARGVIPMTETLEIVSGSEGNPAYIRSRPRMLGRTGSFLKHYEDGKASYVVDAALAPASLGWIEFYITPRKGKHRGQTVTSVEIRSWQ